MLPYKRAANEDVFINYNLISVEWEVNEVTIQDEYQVELDITY